jgi:hypothetical protein
MLTNILTLIGSILPSVLGAFGVSSTIDNLIPALISAITQIISGITNKTPVDTTLVALQAALAALQADTSLSPVILADIAEGVRDLQASIKAYQSAQLVTDPSTLQPLPQIV